VIKFVSDLRQIGGCSSSSPVSYTNKTDRHDITEILLKVAFLTQKNQPTNLVVTGKSFYHEHNIQMY
jgi:hypothetical protein